jgi:RNA polymerase sigma-70 factor (ECF subfamily)
VKRFADVGGEGLVATLFPGRRRGPSTIAAAKELEAHVEEALLGLPDHYRELVILRHLCDVSYEEIAEIMKFTTAETARRACNRALAKLREIVQPKVCPPE